MTQRTIAEIDKEIEKVKAEKAMMEKIAIHMAVVLTTLYEDKETCIPKSPIYMAFGYDLRLYEKVEFALKEQGWITCTTETMSLTETGKIKAQECQQLLNNKKSGG